MAVPPEAMKATAEFLEAAGRIGGVADDYSPYVTEEFAAAAAK